LLPVVIALVFVAAFEGTHDWGDLYSLVFFGIVGWIMKRLGWPRPPMVLGIVVGAIFERYLFISTQLYGWAWLIRPAVLGILACVAWALYRPLAQIAVTLIGQLREVGGRHPRFLRLDRGIYRARRLDRICSRHCGVCLRQYALRLRRTLADRAGFCRGHHLGLLCGLSLGACRGLAAVAARRIVSGFARGDAVVLGANYCTMAAAFFATSGGVW
jgi:hypothetical protein